MKRWLVGSSQVFSVTSRSTVIDQAPAEEQRVPGLQGSCARAGAALQLSRVEEYCCDRHERGSYHAADVAASQHRDYIIGELLALLNMFTLFLVLTYLGASVVTGMYIVARWVFMLLVFGSYVMSNEFRTTEKLAKHIIESAVYHLSTWLLYRLTIFSACCCFD